MTALLAALGPTVVSTLLPFVLTEIAGRKIRTLPRAWMPWLSCVVGGLASALPGMPAGFSPMDGAQGGALAIALNEGLKAFRPAKGAAK